jgi:hypothetical protein
VSAERTTITQVQHPSIKAKFMQKHDKVRDKSAIIRMDSGNQFNTHIAIDKSTERMFNEINKIRDKI